MFGKSERILLVPCCKTEFCVVGRYHNCPPFVVSMSVQNGAMILWEPFIGKGCDVYWVSGARNVTSPLLFTFWKQRVIVCKSVHPKISFFVIILNENKLWKNKEYDHDLKSMHLEKQYALL